MTSGPQNNEDADYIQGLGGGSLLIKNGKYHIGWQGLNPFFEFAATSSLALTNSNTLLLITNDGVDLKEGTFPFEFANLLLTEISNELNVKIKSAMTLDRGGSATLVLCEPSGKNCNLISNSGSGKTGRPIYNGLGIYVK
jgi:hypothetical protein